MTLRTVALATLLSLPALGVSQDFHMNPNEVPTNLAGTTSTIAPQGSFDPVTASDVELEAEGFPPRPDASTHKNSYISWLHAVRSSKNRINPQLELASPHGTIRVPSASTPQADGSITSYNWSGYVLSNDVTKFDDPSALQKVRADITVPSASQPYGSCTGGWTFASTWVGLDGAGTSDVLQAGIEADAYCDPDKKSAYYSAWYEWFPGSSVRVTNLPVAPGNEMYVSVWATSETQGHIYILNYNTGQYTVVNLTAPQGVKLTGRSAEWIVERPGNSTLTDYVAQYFSDARALDNRGRSFGPESTGSVQVVMLGSDNKTISQPKLLGNKSILVKTRGAAWSSVNPSETPGTDSPPPQPASPIDWFPDWLVVF